MQNLDPIKLINTIIVKTRNSEMIWDKLKEDDATSLPISLTFENVTIEYDKSYKSTFDKLMFYLAYIKRTSGRDGSRFIGYELSISLGNEFQIIEIDQSYLYELQTDIEFILKKQSKLDEKIYEFLN